VVAAWRVSRRPVAGQLLAIGMLVAASAPVVLAIPKLFGLNRVPVRHVSGDDVWNTNVGVRPNIYHFILDGYARADTLQHLFAFDNQPFIGELQSRGFVVPERAAANYPTTYLSLASILDTSYPVLGGGAAFQDRRDFYRAIRGRNSTVAGLRRAGYSYVHAGNSWGGSRCSGMEDQCLNDLFGFTVTFSEVEYAVLRMTPLDKVLRFRDADLEAIAGSLGRISVPSPFYFFAHTLPPHAPHTRQADCTPLEERYDDADLVEKSELERSLYRDSVACVNRQALRLVDLILQRDPDALIILQADHGSALLRPFGSSLADWTPGMTHERLRIFLAVRAPAECRGSIGQDLTNVNVMRFVAGCLQGRAPLYLTNRFFLAGYEGSTEFGNVVELASEPN
jgi:hypothetical protein